MKRINNEKIRYKFIFGLFSKPSVCDYLKLHTISKFYDRIILRITLWTNSSIYGRETYLTFENVYNGYDKLLDFAINNPQLKIQAIYFTQERGCYIKCVLGKGERLKGAEDDE